MTYPVVDLSNCDKEPIHILGKVQSHGFLVAVDHLSFNIAYASDNIQQFTPSSPAGILGKPLSNFLESLGGHEKNQDLFSVIKYTAKNFQDNFNPIFVRIGDKDFNLVVHTSGNCIVLEFEPSYSSEDPRMQFLIGTLLSKVLEADSVPETLDKAALQIKELIGYDRVMIYKFGQDGHGEVVAEQKNPDLEPFWGLHYPASDIPRQARELYKINLTRIIADVDATPAPIISAQPRDAEKPLDLTHSALRAVSAIHIEYLKNMGVKASFSVSLIVEDELWGLIACHNYSPKFIDYRSRQYARLIGQVLSSTLQYKISQEEKEINLAYRQAAEEMVKDMHRDWNLADALTNNKNNLLRITNARAAALVFEGKIYRIGETPTEEQIADLTRWLQQNNKKNLFYTHSLPAIYEPANDFRQKASGLMACAISRELGEYIFFFKPEKITTVRWAGNPDKPVEVDEKGQAFLSPRRSFAVWSQEVRGKSDRWSNAELNEIHKFREDIVQFINVKANEIRRLNEKLKEAYDELDTFSFTISHDLKTPIASIRNYSEILLEDFQDMDEQARHFLNRIIGSADKMNALIREVLNYSKLSRQQLHRKNIPMAPILQDLKEELKAAYYPVNLQLTIGDTPDIPGDPVMITQVFSNLLGNAVKYSSKSDPSIVRVEGKREGDNILYTVTDNGVGIDVEYGSHIFELFKRMENAKEYEGSGVGLAIAKRIMEKHNARIWYESEKDNGTIFYLSFQKNGL